jgi:hypothetical protein
MEGGVLGTQFVAPFSRTKKLIQKLQQQGEVSQHPTSPSLDPIAKKGESVFSVFNQHQSNTSQLFQSNQNSPSGLTPPASSVISSFVPSQTLHQPPGHIQPSDQLRKPLNQVPTKHSSQPFSHKHTDIQSYLIRKKKYPLISLSSIKPSSTQTNNSAVPLSVLPSPSTTSSKTMVTPLPGTEIGSGFFKSIGGPVTDGEKKDTSPNRRRNLQGEKLYCICNEPFNGEFMIKCDRCGEWYHGFCVNVSKEVFFLFFYFIFLQF